MDYLTVAAEQFAPEGESLNIREYGSGNVNDTFLVSLSSDQEKNIILQRINTRVFLRPELIMLNMRVFTEHVYKRLKCESASSNRRWEVPRVLPAKDGRDFFLDPQGSFWRSISFVDGSKSYDTVKNIKHAREAGYALGKFHSLISDLETTRLHDTLEGYHIIPQYLRHYDKVLAKNRTAKTTSEVKYGLGFVEKRRKWATVLERAKNQAELFLRPIHGDPKINNIMIDETTQQAVSVVDLDTVKPGLIHYDVGDCLRSCCNPLGEETGDLENIRFDTELGRAILQGYASEANSFLSKNDYLYFYDAIRLIAFELGLRFFTDYLAGNVYFKVKHTEHNLLRSLVQFKLTESIESQEVDIRTIINELRKPAL